MAKTPAREETSPRRTRRGLANPRPRASEDFSFVANSTAKSRLPSDDRTIKLDGPKLELVRPAWTGASGTVVRLLPCFDLQIEDEDVMMPGRRSAREDDMSDWIRGYPAAKYVGLENKMTFLLYDPRLEHRKEYDPNTNPYIILVRAIHDAVEQDEAYIGRRNVLTTKWGLLINEKSKKCAFSWPKYLYYMQALVYQHNGEMLVKNGRPRGLRKNDLPQVLQLTKSAIDSLLQSLRETREGRFDSDDMSQFAIPDPVSLASGPWLTIYNPEKHTVSNEVVTADEEVSEDDFSADDDDSANNGSNNRRRGGGWKCSFSDEFIYVQQNERKKARQDLSPLQDEISSNILWWQNVLHVPCHDELAKLCAVAYRGMPDLLHFAWQDNREFFTDEVRGVLAARTQGQGAEVPALDDEEEENQLAGDTVEPEVTEERKRQSAALPATEDFDYQVDDEDEDQETTAEAAAVDPAAAAAAAAAAARAAKRAARPSAEEDVPRPVKKKKKKVRPMGEQKSVPAKKKKRRPTE